MTYDPNFDQFRLDQLASQFLSGSSVQGKVIFFSDSDDNRLDVSTWRLDDEDYAEFKKSGFRTYLMELLDSLLVYRARHNQPNASQGVVHIDRGHLHLKWVSKEQVESLRSAETLD
jgi:hypothetical protein